MRRLSYAVFCILLALQSGCEMLKEGRLTATRAINSFRPNLRDYADNANDENYVDEWSQAQEARGDRPVEKESDGLTNLTSSPKARAINRSLGID